MKFSLPLSPNVSLQFTGEMIFQQKMGHHHFAEAYISADELIVLVRYPEYQPTDAVEIKTKHAAIPLPKLFRAAGRGRISRMLFGGPENLIHQNLDGHYPIEMIGELLGKINFGHLR